MNAQNVAINSAGTAPNASAMLDVSSTTSGMLIPRMNTIQKNALNPLPAAAQGLVIYQTDGVQGFYYNTSTTTTPSWHYLTPDGWSLTGNAGTTAGTNFIGTTDAVDWVVKTNNAERIRVTSGGLVGIGLAPSSPTYPLQVASSNNTAIYGQTNNTANGTGWGSSNAIAGIYGQGGSGTTQYQAGVVGHQIGTGNNAGGVVGSYSSTIWGGLGYTDGAGNTWGIYSPSNAYIVGNLGVGTSVPAYVLDVNGSSTSEIAHINNASTGDALRTYTTGAVQYAGLFADNTPTTNGSGYGITTANASVQGQMLGTKSYSYGVLGFSSSTGIRTGGVIGLGPHVGNWAALGYYDSGSTDWALYYSNDATTGQSNTGTGRAASPTSLPASGIGIGGVAGLYGALIKGRIYGMNIKGNRYSLYLDGASYTNNILVQLSSSSAGNKRIASYTPASTSVDLSAHGTGQLINGHATVHFPKSFSALISNEKPIIVTVTPLGSSQGIYIVHTDKNGFTVAENNNGTSNVNFNWIAIGIRAGYEKPQVPEELISKNYDQNMNGVMHDENDPNSVAKPVWWNGSQLIFGTPPSNLREKATIKQETKVKHPTYHFPKKT